MLLTQTLVSIIFLTLCSRVYSYAQSPYDSNNNPWDLKQFKTLISFGDSLTDRARGIYIFSNNGSLPPVGWVEPDNNNTPTGGYNWLHYITNPSHDFSPAPSLSPMGPSASGGVTVYNYAVSGAVCSQKITPLYLLDILVPSFLEYEIPAYLADSSSLVNSSTTTTTTPSDQTVYSIWIGTNDLANHGFLADMQEPNKTIPDSIDCIYSALDKLYAQGARYFVLMNIPPMQLAPLYAMPERGGVGKTWAWPDKPGNITKVSYRMWQQVAMVNEAFRYRTGYEVLVARRYAGARIAVMDVNGLMTHIYNNPDEYLAAPANVTGYNNHCNLDMSDCQRLGNPESFIWFDYSHPSQRTEQVIAEHFLDVVRGRSKWAMYFGG